MQSISQLAEQIAESNEAFREQFDRNSSTFHNGLSEPVPTGGTKLPASMPTEFPAEPQLSQEATYFGPEYEKASSLRDSFTELKKCIGVFWIGSAQ